MTLLYLLALLIALTGMIVLDARFRLFFWRDARRVSRQKNKRNRRSSATIPVSATPSAAR